MFQFYHVLAGGVNFYAGFAHHFQIWYLIETMVDEKFKRNFFLVLFIAVSALMLFVFWSFLKIIVFSAVVAVVLYPIYEFLLRAVGRRRGIAAAAMIVLTSLIILTPTFFLGFNLFNESRNLYAEVGGQKSDYINKITRLVEEPVQVFNPEFSLDLGEYVSLAADWVVKNIGSFVSGTAYSIANLIFVIISLYFFLKDGAGLKKVLIKLSPLDDSYDEQIAVKVEKTINSVIRGALLVALIQGVLVGLGLLLFGVPNPTLWGSAAAFAALVPGLGTALVVLPAVAYLYLSGHLAAAIGLAIWGFALVGLIDNFLAPYLYRKGTTVHPLAVLFSVLGGLVAFGPNGFIFGPIVLTLFMSLLEIYREMILKDKFKSNPAA